MRGNLARVQCAAPHRDPDRSPMHIHHPGENLSEIRSRYDGEDELSLRGNRAGLAALSARRTHRRPWAVGREPWHHDRRCQESTRG